MSNKEPGKFSGRWCEVFQEHLDRSRMSVRELAHAIGTSSQVLSSYQHGAARVDLAKVEPLARALKLTPAEREEFVWLAYEPHVPPAVWERLMRAEAVNAAHAQELVKLKAKAAKLKP